MLQANAARRTPYEGDCPGRAQDAAVRADWSWVQVGGKPRAVHGGSLELLVQGYLNAYIGTGDAQGAGQVNATCRRASPTMDS